MDIEASIISQYGAALTMLRSAIGKCPDSLWTSEAFENRSWHIAYHAIFYAHLYLSASEAEFVPWGQSRKNAQYLGAPPGDPRVKPEAGEPYAREVLLSYADEVLASVAQKVRAVPLEGPSGFEWLPLNRLELHIYNIRHIQSHTGQLIDRMRAAGAPGIGWVGMWREKK